jgi:hypothetical protein
MEMASSTISDLRTFVRRRDLLPDVNDDVEGLTFSRYGPSDLASLNFGSIIMVVARMFVLAIFVPAAISSTMVVRIFGSPATSTRLFGYFSLAYWCWYSCRW